MNKNYWFSWARIACAVVICSILNLVVSPLSLAASSDARTADYWPVVCATSNSAGSENDQACLSLGFVTGTSLIAFIHVDTGSNQFNVTLEQAKQGYVVLYRSEGAISKNVVLLDGSRLESENGGLFSVVILREGGLFRDEYRRLNLALQKDSDGLWRLWRVGSNWWDDWSPESNSNWAMNPYAIDRLHFLVRHRGSTEIGIGAVRLGWGGRWYEDLSTDRMPSLL